MAEKQAALIIDQVGKRYPLRSASGYRSLREDIRKIFTPPSMRKKDDFWALRDVSFTVNPGERVGLIGRNGAGKSTLLKLISRVVHPTAGRMTINGRLSSLLEVGTGFHPELTGRENIFLNGAILGMNRAEVKRKFDEIVAFAEVEKFLDTQVKHYSSGMYMRLAFSVAAFLDSEIMLLDETLAVGDIRFQEKCLDTLKGLQGDRARTLLFVTHNYGIFKSLCQRAVSLKQGQVVYDGVDLENAWQQAYGLSAKGDGDKGEKVAMTKPLSIEDVGKINSMRLVDGHGNAPHMLAKYDDLFLEIDVDLNHVPQNLTFGYFLYNENQQQMYQSSNGDRGEMVLVNKSLIRTRLPIEILAQGRYMVSLIVTLHGDRNLIHDNPQAQLFFHVSHQPMADSIWTQKRSGDLIAPSLPWEVKNLA